jgi:5'-nucleotidase
MKKKRIYRENCSASSALLGLGLSLTSFGTTIIKQLTILHTNDVHSYIDPFLRPSTECQYGWCSTRAALIESIRKKSNVLLLDAGIYFKEHHTLILRW